MDKRRARRRALRLAVRLGPNGIRAMTGDMSVTGVFVSTARVFRPGTVLRLLVDTPGGVAWADGVVRWAKRVPPSYLLHTRGGMGIELVRMSPELRAYLTSAFPEMVRPEFRVVLEAA